MEKKKCITFGEFNKKYCYFLLGAFIINIFIIILLISFNIYTEGKKINIFNSLNILSYPFFLSFSEILMIIPNLILHKVIKSQKTHFGYKQHLELLLNILRNHIQKTFQ